MNKRFPFKATYGIGTRVPIEYSVEHITSGDQRGGTSDRPIAFRRWFFGACYFLSEECTLFIVLFRTNTNWNICPSNTPRRVRSRSHGKELL